MLVEALLQKQNQVQSRAFVNYWRIIKRFRLQYDRLLAWYCHRSVCLSLCLKKCIG